MKADCHIHMLLDGEYWKSAIDGHRDSPDTGLIRRRLEAYREAGFTYLRDGGDRWGVCKAARDLASEYGITYRTPLSPLCHAGHYGSFIGKKYMNLKGYTKMVVETGRKGGDFIKIMISGLMDFDRYGQLTEEGLDAAEVRQMIHIAHEEGFSVMAHANGARTVEVAALAGVDSVEHGAYLDAGAMQAMKENGVVWVPTVSTIANLRGRGRYTEEDVEAIFESAVRNIRIFADMGGLIAPGSDAGAWAVPHCGGGLDEYDYLGQILGDRAEQTLVRGIRTIMEKF